MIRVVHVVVAGEVGGAERMLVELASRSEETGAEHALAVISPDRRLAALFRAANIRVHDRVGPEGPVPFLRQTFGRREVEWLSGVLSRERAQVAHLHTFASQVLGTRAARHVGVRVLRTEHSTRAFDDRSCWPFSRWSLARADVSVSVSEHVRSAAAGRAPRIADRLHVVHNGVDTAHFSACPPPEGRPFAVAAVGRLEPRKGVDRAILAVARTPHVRLAVVGDGPERPSLERLARRLGAEDRVTFHGFVDDPRDAVAACHAVLSASRSEGLGVALLEAMAMGRPVVGFRVGGIPEIVDDRRTGLLAPADDVGALAGLLLEASRDPSRLEALGAAARARVVERFSVGAMCAGYARAYARAASAGDTMHPA